MEQPMNYLPNVYGETSQISITASELSVLEIIVCQGSKLRPSSSRRWSLLC